MKTNLDKAYQMDDRSVKEGAWMITGPDLDQEFLIKPFRSTNPTFKAAYARHFKPYARQIDNDTLDSKKEREVMARFFCEACLVDWKGIEIDGEYPPYSKDLAVKLLTHIPELFEDLMAFSKDFKNYRADYKEDVGNSSAAT